MIDIRKFPRVVVVTGCDSGFGLLSSISLQKLGFHVISACLTDDGIDHISSDVELSVKCDITKEADVVRVCQTFNKYLRKIFWLQRKWSSKSWDRSANCGVS